MFALPTPQSLYPKVLDADFCTRWMHCVFLIVLSVSFQTREMMQFE